MVYKIINGKKYLYTCLILIIVSFIVEAIVVNAGADWYSRQFYILRCINQLSFHGLTFYFLNKLIRRFYTQDNTNKSLKSFHLAKTIIASLTIIACIVDIFRNVWMEPGSYGSQITIYFAGIFFVLIPLSLEKHVTENNTSKLRKSDVVTISILAVLGTYMLSATVYNYLVIFKIMN